jgi:hypothetical protein
MTRRIQSTESTTADITRSLNISERNVLTKLVELQGKVNDDQRAEAEARVQMQARTNELIQATATQSLAAITALQSKFGDIIEQHASHTATELKSLQDMVAAEISQLQQRVEQSMAEQSELLSQKQKQHGNAFESRFTTFKGSVSTTVTEMNTNLSMLNEKVDTLANKLAQILKTVVIM